MLLLLLLLVIIPHALGSYVYTYSLTNSDFETDSITGNSGYWQYSVPSGWIGYSGVAIVKSGSSAWLDSGSCQSNSQCAVVQMKNSYIAQTLSLPAANSAVITFYITSRRDCNSLCNCSCSSLNNIPVKILYGSSLLGTFYTTSSWMQHSTSITSTTSDRTEYLYFKNGITAYDYSFLVDLVAITVTAPDPTQTPTVMPTKTPTVTPTKTPTVVPTKTPTVTPTVVPTATPTVVPTITPTKTPTVTPTVVPTTTPTVVPTTTPTVMPTTTPTVTPTVVPTSRPTTPSSTPTGQPSSSPTRKPSMQPSSQPSSQPSTLPTRQPTAHPTNQPTSRPSGQPTSHPSMQPTTKPSSQPSAEPSTQPTSVPSSSPSSQPTIQPTTQPSSVPSSSPSSQPTMRPTRQPTAIPTSQPTNQPTSMPSGEPSSLPSSQPSSMPTSEPSAQPSGLPSGQPTLIPTLFPSGQPTSRPSLQPTTQPSASPSSQPSSSPSSQPTPLDIIYANAFTTAVDSKFIIEKTNFYLGSFVGYFCGIFLFLWLVERSGVYQTTTRLLYDSAYASKVYIKNKAVTSDDKHVDCFVINNLYYLDKQMEEYAVKYDGTHDITIGNSSVDFESNKLVTVEASNSYSYSFYRYLLQKRCIQGCTGVLYPAAFALDSKWLNISIQLPPGRIEDMLVHLCSSHRVFSCIYSPPNAPISTNGRRFMYIAQYSVAFSLAQIFDSALYFGSIPDSFGISVMVGLVVINPIALGFGSLIQSLWLCQCIERPQFKNENPVIFLCLQSLGKVIIVPLLLVILIALVIAAIFSQGKDFLYIILSFFCKVQVMGVLLEIGLIIMAFKVCHSLTHSLTVTHSLTWLFPHS